MSLREDLSKHRLKEMRRHGMIPGNFYGKGKPTLALEVGLAGLAEALRTEAGIHAMFDVKIGGAKSGEDGTAIIKQISKDALTRKVLHIEFERVSASDKIVTTVGVVLIGDAPGIHEGGILETVMDQIEVKARADQMLSHIDVDVSNLSLGDFVHAADISLPEGVELASRPDDIVVAMRLPHIHAAAPAAAAETEAAGVESATPEAEPPSEEG